MSRPISHQQLGLLSHLLATGTAPTIMALCRYEHAGKGHRASYARVHRMAARGLVALEYRSGRATVSITPAGIAVHAAS